MSVNYKYLIEERDAALQRAKDLEVEVEVERKKALEEIARLEEVVKALAPSTHKSLPTKGAGAYQEQLETLLTWDNDLSGSPINFARELLAISPNKTVFLRQAAGITAQCAVASVDPDVAYRIECLSVGSLTAAKLECLRLVGNSRMVASIAIGIFPALFGHRIKRIGH